MGRGKGERRRREGEEEKELKNPERCGERKNATALGLWLAELLSFVFASFFSFVLFRMMLLKMTFGILDSLISTPEYTYSPHAGPDIGVNVAISPYARRIGHGCLLY